MKAKIGFILVSATAMLALGQNQHRGHGGPQMDDATKAAFESCATSSGMPERGSGKRPTEAQESAFRTCLSGKGISMPEHHGRPPGENDQRGQRPPPSEEDSSSVGTAN